MPGGTHSLPHAHTHTYARTHTGAHTYAHTHICTRARTYTHAHTHAYIHTHTITHAYKVMMMLRLVKAATMDMMPLLAVARTALVTH